MASRKSQKSAAKSSPGVTFRKWKSFLFAPAIMLRRPRGCDECGQTGYRGRIGIYELFSVDRRARGLMQRRGIDVPASHLTRDFTRPYEADDGVTAACTTATAESRA